MTTPQPSLELARQGDPVAIAHLINQALQSRNITARVTRQDACLRIMLEAEQVPDQPTLVSYFQQNLAKLKIAAITTVELYGKQACAMAPGWRQIITLEPPSGATATSVPPSSSTAGVVSKPVVDGPRQTAIATPPAQRLVPVNARTQKIYQAVLSGVVALVLILIGANIRSVSNLFATKPQSATTKAVAIDNLKSGTYRATIINRLRGVPVIMVTFNDSQPFPMIVDTGAAGTLITRSMAATLGVVPEGQVIAQTANGYTTLDVGYVASIEVDGAKMTRIPVAIGLPDMDYGLLGHDFFGHFDVTVRENIVEFRTRDE